MLSNVYRFYEPIKISHNHDYCIYLIFFFVADFYKIKLLKNYNRIVENILPMEVISNMPYYTLPERDRNDILRSQTQGQKARTLLNILITSHEKAYYSFLNALRADVVFKDLADEIEKTPGIHKYINKI